MKTSTENVLNELIKRYSQLEIVKNDILDAYFILEETYKNGKKVLVCGNGGSAADSEHIVGELMKKFKKKREIDKIIYDRLSLYGEEGEKLKKTLEGSLRSLSLTSHFALSSAFANDREYDVSFAQQLYGLGDEGDTLIAISTSGNSENCVLAAVIAKAKRLKIISLTGEQISRLSVWSDVTIKVPERETYKVQELHLPIYHALCAMLEEEFF